MNGAFWMLIGNWLVANVVPLAVLAVLGIGIATAAHYLGGDPMRRL